MKRRQFVSLMGAAAALKLPVPESQTAGASKAQTKPVAQMHVGCQRAPTDAKALAYFKRHAVDHICGYPPNANDPAGYTVDALKQLRALCDSNGVALDMIQFPLMASSSIDATDRKGIMLAKEPDRQRDIDSACEIIKNTAAAGI